MPLLYLPTGVPMRVVDALLNVPKNTLAIFTKKSESSLQQWYALVASTTFIEPMKSYLNGNKEWLLKIDYLEETKWFPLISISNPSDGYTALENKISPIIGEDQYKLDNLLWVMDKLDGHLFDKMGILCKGYDFYLRGDFTSKNTFHTLINMEPEAVKKYIFDRNRY